MRIGSVLRSAEIALITIISALVLGTCAGSGRRAVVQPQDRVAPPVQAADDESLDKALMELEGMQCPEGVDEKLWGELKDALEEALNDSCRAGIYPRRSATGMDGGGHKWPPYSEGIRFVSTPPGDRVSDLTLTDHYDATYTLSWRYRNLGDYDQNGTVGISDITPLAIHYNEEVPEDDREQRASIQAVVDGSANDKVDIADITPIAMNYGTCCAAYSIRSASSYPESIEDTSEVGAAPIALAEGEDRKTLSVELAEEPRTYIAVAPMDADETPGELSNVLTIPNHPPVAQITAEPTEGDAPLDVAFDASGSSDIDGPIAKYEWDWEGDGVFDHDSGTAAEVEHTYDIAQAYDPQVRVTDEHNGTDTTTTTVTAGAWRIFTAVEETPAFFTDIDLVNGNPAICYNTDLSFEGELVYVRATDAMGTTWGEPVVVDNEVVASPSLTVVNGRPAIAYYGGEDHELMYARANDANGDSWGEPLAVAEARFRDSQQVLSLVVVSGNPAMAYEGNEPDGLAYVRALDANGDSWGSPVLVAYMYMANYNSMAVINGRPAISYTSYEHIEDNYLLKYVRALDGGGNTWGFPIALERMDPVKSSLAEINGNPAISYAGYLDDMPILKYVRALDANGSAWGTPLILDNEILGGWPSLATIQGRPAISYVEASGDTCTLRYVQAADPDGTIWHSPMTVQLPESDEGGATYMSFTEINGHPGISYYFIDVAQGIAQLRYAVYY